MHYSALNKIINSLMDDLVPTFESDEEDEEYVPSESEESEESEDEEYVPSESEESEESEDEEYVPSESESEEEKTSPRMKICTHSSKTKIPTAACKAIPSTLDVPLVSNKDKMYIYFNRPLEVDEDRIVIYPGENGFKVQYEYNRNPVPTQVHEFEGDAAAVLEYLSDVFCLVSIDQKPFTELEFMIPFYPNISITPNNFTGVVATTILRAVGSYLEHYAE